MSKNIRIKILTFIRYLGDSFFYPFLAIYLKSLTFGETRIGILIAATPLIAIIVNPIYSKICKNAQVLKIVLGTISLLEGIGIVLLSLVTNYYVILGIIIFVAITGTSHYGLLDSLSTIYSEYHHINFSNIRVYGSVAYAIGTTISGIVIENLGYTFSFGICMVLFLISSIMYYTLGKVSTKEDDVKVDRSYREVFTNKGFILYFFFYFLLYGTMKTNQNFYGLLIEHRGLSSGDFGLIYTSFVFVEVVTLIILDKFDKKIKYNIIAFSIALQTVILFFVNGSDLPVTVLLIVGLLRGTAYAMILHINYKILVRLVGVRNATIAILLLELSINIFVIIGNGVGGVILEFMSYKAFYWILAGIQAFAMIFYLIFVRKYIKEIDNTRALELSEVQSEE